MTRLSASDARRHKYNAKPVVVDGIRFASTAEARRWGELKLMERAGIISCLKRQPVFKLHAITPFFASVLLGKYIADFMYLKDGGYVTEDVKGYQTAHSRWKIAHAEAEYATKIRLIRSQKAKRSRRA